MQAGRPRAGPPGSSWWRQRAHSRTRDQGLQEGHRVEVVDVDDVEPGQTHLEGVHIVFKVDDLQASPLSEAGAPWDADRSSRSTSTLSSVGSSLGEALLWSILMSNSGSSSHHWNRWDDDHDSWSSGSSWGGSSGGGGGISSDQGNF